MPVDSVPSELIEEARKAFKSLGHVEEALELPGLPEPCTIYEHRGFLG